MKKVSLAQQLEECHMALADYAFIKDRPSVKEFRIKRMAALGDTIEWMIKNEQGIRHWMDQQKRDSLAEKIGV
jgi:hypothetical protein